MLPGWRRMTQPVSFVFFRVVSSSGHFDALCMLGPRSLGFHLGENWQNIYNVLTRRRSAADGGSYRRLWQLIGKDLQQRITWRYSRRRCCMARSAAFWQRAPREKSSRAALRESSLEGPQTVSTPGSGFLVFPLACLWEGSHHPCTI